jgi:hypothetical protein
MNLAGQWKKRSWLWHSHHMNKNKKSPIKDKPLRYVGQSLDEQIDKLINDGAIYYLVTAFLVVWLAGYEWWRYFKNPPPSPKSMTFLAIIISSFCIYKIWKIIKKVKKLRLGREGERAVGQYLECLREKGHRIFHDIIGDNFNLDHVIISKKGIFVVETKTYSKPEKGKATIIFNGDELTIDGFKGQNKQISQVKAAAKWLKNVLSETTGKEFCVQPVVLFPGWYVESTSKGKAAEVWVLNPKALPTYIENKPEILSQGDMMLASFHISRYIRSKEATR